MRYSLIHGNATHFDSLDWIVTNYLRQVKRKSQSKYRTKTGWMSRESDCMNGKKDFNFEEVRNRYRRNFLESGLKNK